MKVNVTFKKDVLVFKTKLVKVYGKGEKAYILYKGDKVPFNKLKLKENGDYFLNVFLYYKLEDDEYDEYMASL